MSARAVLLGTMIAVMNAAPVLANDDVPRHWIARVGLHPVSPRNDGDSDFSVGNAAGVSLGATYLLTKHWATELFATFPTSHDVHATDGGKLARFSMISTTATLQYHITDPGERFRAYAAAGVAHAHIGNERSKALLEGQALQLEDSTGLTVALGLDMKLGTKWFVNVDARWMDIDSSMRIGSVPRGTLQIDPLMLGLSLGRRLR